MDDLSPGLLRALARAAPADPDRALGHLPLPERARGRRRGAASRTTCAAFRPGTSWCCAAGTRRSARCAWPTRTRRRSSAPTSHIYWLPVERVINAILLGVLTYDANLLVLDPPEQRGLSAILVIENVAPLAAALRGRRGGLRARLPRGRHVGRAPRAARLQPVPHLRLPDARLLRVAARGGARAPAVPDRRDAPGPAPVAGRAAGLGGARGADPEEPRAAPAASASSSPSTSAATSPSATTRSRARCTSSSRRRCCARASRSAATSGTSSAVRPIATSEIPESHRAVPDRAGRAALRAPRSARRARGAPTATTSRS